MKDLLDTFKIILAFAATVTLVVYSAVEFRALMKSTPPPEDKTIYNQILVCKSAGRIVLAAQFSSIERSEPGFYKLVDLLGHSHFYEKSQFETCQTYAKEEINMGDEHPNNFTPL